MVNVCGQSSSLAAPPPKMVNSVIEALKRAQRNFQETFYETPPAVDATVRNYRNSVTSVLARIHLCNEWACLRTHLM